MGVRFFFYFVATVVLAIIVRTLNLTDNRSAEWPDYRLTHIKPVYGRYVYKWYIPHGSGIGRKKPRNIIVITNIALICGVPTW